MWEFLQQLVDGLSRVVQFFEDALSFALLPFQFLDVIADYLVTLVTMIFLPLVYVPVEVAAVFVFVLIFGLLIFICSLIVGLIL